MATIEQRVELAATGAATSVLRSLKATFGPLILVQPGGCSDGGSPVCLREGELLPGDDVLLGKLEDVPFYCDHDEFERMNRPRLVLDVAPGPAEGFSLEALAGVHFLTAREVCEDRLDR